MTRIRVSRRPAFTLIEIMIVMVILALLLLLTLPQMARQKYQAQLSACSQNERGIAAALETYRTREGSYPASLTQSFFSNYMGKGVIACPMSKIPYTLDVNGALTDYTVVCAAGLHELGLPSIASAGYPQYTPKSGLSVK